MPSRNRPVSLSHQVSRRGVHYYPLINSFIFVLSIRSEICVDVSKKLQRLFWFDRKRVYFFVQSSTRRLVLKRKIYAFLGCLLKSKKKKKTQFTFKHHIHFRIVYENYICIVNFCTTFVATQPFVKWTLFYIFVCFIV